MSTMLRRATEPFARRPHAGVTVLAAAALGVCAYATTLPWLCAGFGDESRVFAGSELAPLAWMVRTLCGLTAVAFLVAGVRGRIAARLLAITGAACVALLTGALIGTVETIATLVPDSMLPNTIRRLTLVIRAGEGLWLAFAASLFALLAAVPWTDRRPRLLTGHISIAVVVPPLALFALTLAFAFLRYEPWLQGGAATREFELEAWATPWLGPFSLAVVWLLVTSCMIALFGARWIAGLVAAGAGWAMTFLASLAVTVSAAAGRLGIDALVPGEWREYAPTFEVVPGAWLVFAAGLAAAAVGAALIASSHRVGDQSIEEATWPLP